MKDLCSFMFFTHNKCKHELHQLKADKDKKINDLELEIIQLINQIQELKAMNHYQAFELELKINSLEEENRLLKDKIEADKHKKREHKVKHE